MTIRLDVVKCNLFPMIERMIEIMKMLFNTFSLCSLYFGLLITYPFFVFGCEYCYANNGKYALPYVLTICLSAFLVVSFIFWLIVLFDKLDDFIAHVIFHISNFYVSILIVVIFIICLIQPSIIKPAFEFMKSDLKIITMKSLLQFNSVCILEITSSLFAIVSLALSYCRSVMSDRF